MQSVWQLNGSRELILFFTGWAMDEKPTQHLQTQRDICTCFYYGMEEDFSVNAQRFLECGTPVPLWYGMELRLSLRAQFQSGTGVPHSKKRFACKKNPTPSLCRFAAMQSALRAKNALRAEHSLNSQPSSKHNNLYPY